jgi:CheY-like chemotaxis protein/anti-sigma regulatory factor (Ser/Thr protein kinase)
MVVEDDRAGRELLETLLTEEGHRIETAVDGEAAWARLQAGDPRIDVVLVDWVMPRLNGLELLERMKETDGFEMIPVVFQSARSDRESMRTAIAAGAFYYVSKPVDPQLLKTVVAAAVEDHERYQALQQTLHRGAQAALTLDEGLFRFHTIEQAGALATLLSRACPDPERTVVGLGELLVNAVEHGNLGITYEEKTTFLEEHSWEEEIERRLKLPENGEKRAEVRFERLPDRIVITIIDQGEGFDWQRFLTVSPERVFHAHGRGIAMANLMSFDRLEYEAPGNRVTATLDLGEESST